MAFFPGGCSSITPKTEPSPHTTRRASVGTGVVRQDAAGRGSLTKATSFVGALAPAAADRTVVVTTFTLSPSAPAIDSVDHVPGHEAKARTLL